MSDAPVRLLLIEDNAALADMLREILAGASQRFLVEVRDTLAGGIERLRQGSIDVVLLDLILPDSVGAPTLNRLHAVDADVPIVVLTAMEEENLALQAVRDGAQDYLVKGEINRVQMVRSIRYAIERKRSEEAHLRLAAIVASSHDAIIGMNLDGAIVSWNGGAEGIYGYTAAEALHQSTSLLIPTDASDQMPALFERLKQGEQVKDFETLARTKDGRTFHVAVSISPVVNSRGRRIGFSMMARNVEERKRAEKEREDLIARLQSALSQVHALKGLLPICASCKKIRDDKGYWTQVEEYVKARSSAEFTHGICPDCLERYKWDIASRV